MPRKNTLEFAGLGWVPDLGKVGLHRWLTPSLEIREGRYPRRVDTLIYLLSGKPAGVSGSEVANHPYLYRKLEAYRAENPRVTLEELVYPPEKKLEEGEVNHHEQFLKIIKSVVAKIRKEKAR